MGKVIILGHGGFDPSGCPYAPEVLVPPGTTLQFYSDAGQALVLPAKDGNTDYNKVIKVWDHFQPTDSAIPAKWVTYNFSLAPEDNEEERTLAMSLDWGGTVVSTPQGSKDFFLCTGTADTCPTPALNVQQKKFEDDGEGEAVADDRWNHHCNGILGQAAGSEIHWVACTSFEEATPDMPALVTSDKTGPGLAPTTDWSPDDSDLAEVQQLNQQNVKDTDGGGTVSIAAGGVLVLIGEGHSRQPAEYVRRQQDLEEGQITVKKGGLTSKGSLVVTGISAKQALVKSLLEDFSDKKVSFT